MNVSELRDRTDGDVSVVLHRHVTVVRPADEARRAWVLRLVGLIAEERGLAAETVVVRGEDLPSHDPTVAAAVLARDGALTFREQAMSRLKNARSDLTEAIEERARIAIELEAVLHGDGPARDVVAFRQAERARRNAELDSARHQREISETVLAAAVHDRASRQRTRNAAMEGLDRANTRRRSAVEEAMAAAAALESARSLTISRADPSPDLADARQRLAEAVAEAGNADPDGVTSPLSRRLVDLERHRVHLARRLAATGNSATGAVDESLTAVLKGAEVAPSSVAVLALADTWRDLHQQIDALDRGVSDDERTAEANLTLAQRSLAESEIVASQPLLTPEQIAKVDEAHNAVLRAQDRSKARFGGSRARKRLEDLRSDERRVLERLGFSTYADYMMSSSSRDMSASSKSVEAARTSVLAAQERLDAIPGASHRARRRIELLGRRDVVAPKIAELLGCEPAGPEAEEELRALREPVGDEQEQISALASALGVAGIDVGASPYERDDLILLARAYLTEDKRAATERFDLEAAIAAIDSTVTSLWAARDKGEVDVPDGLTFVPMSEPDGSDDGAGHSPHAARWAAVEAARAAVDEAQGRAARHDGLSEELSALEVALDEAGRREREAANGVAGAEASLAAAGDQGEIDHAATEVADAESALARNRSIEAAAEAAVGALDGTGTEELQATIEAALKAAEGIVTDVAAEEQHASTDLQLAEAALESAIEATATAEAAAFDQDRETLVGDIDWALLNRLAAIHASHQTEPAPLVLDEPFGALPDDEVTGVLERLSQFAPRAQIIVVSNRAAVADWAVSAGPDRADVVAA